MLEEPKIKKVDKRDKQLPQNFEQLIDMYAMEKIWLYIKKIIDYIKNKLTKVVVSSIEPTTNEKIWMQRGKNLFNIKKCSAKTQNGLTWTPNIANGCIDVTGTATGYSAIPLIQKFVPKDDFVISLNGKMSNVSNLAIQVNLYKGSVSTDLGSIYSIDISEYDFDYFTISLKRSSNVEIKASVKVQIEYGTEVTEYEPYIDNNKIYTKGKDGKYEVFMEEDITVSATEPNENRGKVWIQHSKNLFNKDNYYVDSKNSIGFNLDLEIGKTYTLSSNKPLYVAKFAKTSDQADGTEGPQTWSSFTSWTFVAEGATVGKFHNRLYLGIKQYAVSTDIADFTDYNIQIEEGTVATEYKPYIGKKIYCKNNYGLYDVFYDEENVIKTKTYTNSFENVGDNSTTGINVPFSTMFPTLNINDVICFNAEVTDVYTTWDRVFANVLMVDNASADQGTLQIRSYAMAQMVKVRVTAFYK